MFNTLKEALDYIDHAKKFSKRTSLDDLEEALALLGNPEKDYEIIHVGGTNGKGSVTKSLSKILELTDKRVGLYVSPFVICPNERISINSIYISDEDLLDYINFIHDFNLKFSENHNPLGFFEMMTLIAFKYYSDNKCDIVVLEVGLGGRLDATNVCTPLISAVTNIQKDHMAQLGNTYKKILMEKLGIMKDGIPFATSIKREELVPIIKKYATAHNSDLYFVRNVRNIHIDETGTSFAYKGRQYKTRLIGIHQAYNAALVIEIIHILNTKYNFGISEEMIDEGLSNVSWPGRFELFNNNIIIDGGHNKEGILALKNTILSFTNKKITVCFTAMKDKETDKMVDILDSFADEIHFTDIDYRRCDNAESLYNLSHNQNKHLNQDYVSLFHEMMERRNDDEVILFCGSLYYISRIRHLLLNEELN